MDDARIFVVAKIGFQKSKTFVPVFGMLGVKLQHGINHTSIFAIAWNLFKADFDAANGTNATSANPTTNAIVSTVNGAIYFAFTAGGWQTFAPTARTGTSLYETDDGATGGGGQYLLQETAGSQAMTWTMASDDWGAVGVAFKEVDTPISQELLPRKFRRYVAIQTQIRS